MRKKNLFLLIFAIILCIYPSYNTAEIRAITHVEERQDYGPVVTPRVNRVRVFDDNTILARIVRKNSAASTQAIQVFYDVFFLRIIYPNGTIVEKDIKLDIPQFNYNLVFVEAQNTYLNFIDYYMVRNNQIVITYFNATNELDVTTYEEWGMVIDFDGKELDRVFFTPAFLFNGKLTANGNSRIVLNINREKGFIILSNSRDTIGLTVWQQFKIEPDGKFTKLTSGTEYFWATSLVSNIISTIDEGYAILDANTTSTAVATNPLLPQGQLSMTPIGYNQTASSSLILYQTSLPNITFNGLICDLAYAGVGQTCVLTITQDGVRRSFVQVDFLSTGSVIDINIIDDLLPIPPNAAFPVWSVNSLQYGGFLLTNIVPWAPKAPDKGIFGYVYDGEQNLKWEFDEPVHSNVEGIFAVLPNNTIVVSQFEANNTWQFLATDLYKVVGDKDRGYSNVHVEGTYPQILNTISPRNIFQISINFYEPIVLSNGKLSIYQVDDDQNYILRQTIPANTGFSIGNDSRTITADVLESTFSVSNANYFITFDNEFVKDMGFNEPLLGVKNNVWRFTTEGVKEKFAPGAAGLLRLTPDGTRKFDGFSSEEKRNFFNDLKNEISLAVPIKLDRLNTIENNQVDKGLNEKQYLVSIGIKETRNDYENSVATIIKLIDIMVKNQDQSPLGSGKLAGFLDETYGFRRFPDLWEKYKTRLVGLFIIIGILFALFFFAQRKYSEGNNIAVLRLGVILFDLIMDVLFVSSNAKDVPVLYIPSVVFVTLPIAINTTLAFYIITHENTRPKFFQWFSKNGNVASLFTVLAGADIEALTILKSNLAGFEFFNAPFSQSAETKIFWGAFLNIFTEDIPQVIIQIYYRRKTVAYDIIPLLTLISSSVNLIINIVGRLYQATNLMRDYNKNKYDTPNDHAPGDDEDDDGFGLSPSKTDGKKDRSITGDDSAYEKTEKTDEKPEISDEKIEKTVEKTDETYEKIEKTDKTEKVDEKTEKIDETEKIEIVSNK